MAKKKKDEEEDLYYKDKTFVKGAKKIQTKTKAGSILTEGTIQEELPGSTPNAMKTRQKKFKGVIDPATARLQQLSGGEGFLKEGTPEQQQFMQEFPQGSNTIFDEEAARFMSPSSSNAEIGRLRLQSEQRKKEAIAQQQQQDLEMQYQNFLNQGQVTEEGETGAVSTIAQIGTFIPVATANLISKGLSLVGVDIGTLDNKKFASTTLGKTLGLTTAAVGAVAGAAAIGSFAASVIPMGALPGEAGLAVTTKAITAGAVAKTGIASLATSSNLVKLAIGGAAVSLIESRISNLETSVVNQRESLTLVGSAVDAGALSKTEAILMFDEIEQSMNESEKAMKITSIFSVRAWLGKGKEIETRIEKARLQLLVERGKLAERGLTQ